MTRIQKINVKRLRILYHNACGYKKTFFGILKNVDKFTTDELFVSTAVVNGMLAIELFIKFLYASKHINQYFAEFFEGHQLWDLYKKLDRKTKGAIRNQINSKIYYFMQRIIKNNKSGKGIYGDVIQWRYLNDDIKKYKINFDYMVKIIYVLYDLSNTKCRQESINNVKLPVFSSAALSQESIDIINDRIYCDEDIG